LPLTKRWCSAIAFSWNRSTSLPRQSILRLAAVRRLAYEAADVGLLSPDLAAGIRRVKGAKRLGVRLGNWLSAGQAKELIRSPDLQTTGGQRDHAILALLLGCGLRRSEVVHLTIDHLQRRDDCWAIVDLFWKGRAHSIGTRSQLG
jgi:site-specific recombinase XerD